MEDTKKRNESERGREGEVSGSLRTNSGQTAGQPGAVMSSSKEEDLKEKKRRNAALSENFFLSED